jgi:hypothetical protein
MKNSLWPAMVVALALLLVGCFDSNRGSTVTVVEKKADLGQSLDLKAVGDLARGARDAEDLERKLNQPGGINNLDLDQTGQVNYINVTEFARADGKGFDLSTRLKDGTTINLASIQISSPDGRNATLAISGNRQYYNEPYYESHFPLTELLIYSWLFAPHVVYYHQPYGWGAYPGYYHSYVPVTRTVYTTRTSTQPSSFRAAPAPTNTRSVVDPAQSQKSFQVRDSAKTVGSGGFGGSDLPRVRRTGSFGKKR